MICPLTITSDCVKDNCAWWFHDPDGPGMCAITRIAIAAHEASEAQKIEDEREELRRLKRCSG